MPDKKTATKTIKTNPNPTKKTAPAPIWQHKVPQSSEQSHEIIYGPHRLNGRPVCTVCKKYIIQVDANEGPESLKNLMRMG
jgi:hypothetical protein